MQKIYRKSKEIIVDKYPKQGSGMISSIAFSDGIVEIPENVKIIKNCHVENIIENGILTKHGNYYFNKLICTIPRNSLKLFVFTKRFSACFSVYSFHHLLNTLVVILSRVLSEHSPHFVKLHSL